jgi:hypothetical protein
VSTVKIIFRAKFSSSNLNLGLRVPERGGDFSIHIYMLMYQIRIVKKIMHLVPNKYYI